MAQGLWGKDWQCTFFDVRVFNPFVQSHQKTSLTQCYRRQEQDKRRHYEKCVREIEHGSFSPLVFTMTGGMGATTTVVYKRIASRIAEKYDKPYSQTLHWMRCKFSFSLLISAIMCLRGSRSAIHCPATFNGDSIDLACSEGQVPTQC